jgi:Protein of unknown function (DUF2628)
MASWIVMQSPDRRREADLAFVRDGFSLFAFLLPPLWLLWHRLWVEAVLTFAVLMLGAGLERLTGFAAAMPLLVSIFIGLEGNGLRIAALGRRGWRDCGVVDADTLNDAETRYAARTSVDEELTTDRTPMRPSANVAGASPALGEPLGLLLNPGR